MKLFGRKDKAEKPKKVKHGAKIKAFLRGSLYFEEAYGQSTAPFPKVEVVKAGNTLKREDVLDAFQKLTAWNDGLAEPNPKLDQGLRGLSAVL